MSRRQLISSEGPSWQDVSIMLQNLHSVHGVSAGITITSTGANYAGACSVTVDATAPVLVGPARVWQARLLAEFPTHRHRTIEGLIYRLLLELDHKASSELYVQQQFA
jgi:hypothetical protein